MRSVLRVVSIALITAGLVVLVDVAMTLIWKEPLSSVYGAIAQGDADEDLARLSEDFAADEQVALLEAAITGQGEDAAARLAARLAPLLAKQVDAGDAIGRLEIPAIDLDAVLLEGTGTATLQRGPGHYPGTAFPGEGKTVAVAGHRTTYLAPFRRINELRPGDRIMVRMSYGRFTYRVQRTRIVLPTALWVTHDVGYDRLVLSACHPLYSAAQRIIVFARLQSVTPLGPA